MGHFLSYASVALLTAFRCGGGREVSSMQSDADFLYILSGKDGLGWLGGERNRTNYRRGQQERVRICAASFVRIDNNDDVIIQRHTHRKRKRKRKKVENS